jgi:hypothetical protein
MGLECKYFNKIKKKNQKQLSKLPAQTLACAGRTPKGKKYRKTNQFFFQSCPHRPCALTHRVCEGNFLIFIFIFIFKIFFGSRLHRQAQTLACAGGA